MRFEGPIKTDELNFIPLHDPSPGAVKGFRKERTRYVHRCPFSHCPHQDVLSSHVENDARGIKVSLSTLDGSSNIYVPNWASLRCGDDLRQGRYVARGTVNSKVTSQYRLRAILYM